MLSSGAERLGKWFISEIAESGVCILISILIRGPDSRGRCFLGWGATSFRDIGGQGN